MKSLVDGGRVTAIVTPWQPLRLAAMAAKALQVASLLRYLLTADEVLFGDPPLFFKQLQEELAHPYYAPSGSTSESLRSSASEMRSPVAAISPSKVP